MRFLIFFFISLIIFSSSIQAEKLTVIADYPQAQIYVDNQLVFNKENSTEVTPGKHHIKIVLDHETIYSRTIMVQEDIDQVINTTRFINLPTSSIPNLGARKIEEQRLSKAKGNMGVGAHFGTQVCGLSLKSFVLRYK